MGYTKGPWYRMGTTVYALNPRDFNRFSAQVQDAHTPQDELISNAVLIQHAPDLLEALERLVNLRDVGMLSDYTLCKDAIDIAKIAIRRAKGEAE